MEQISCKPLNYKRIDNPAKEIVQYIDSRRKGYTRSLRTRWTKFNNMCMGGIEPNTIITLAGISGSGKSSWINSLECDLFDLNPNEDFVILSFNYEMQSSKQIGRKLSYKLGMTTTELYSGINKLGDDKFKQIQKATEEIKKYPIYYVDIPGNVDRMKETILQFMENEGKGKWIIIILDHTLLVRNRTGESERETLSQLQYMFMELKKYGKNTIIQLSQMNRKIESPERIQNISMHYPMRTDVFGSESVYQASDLLFVLHRPELILKNGAYGPDNLPIEGLIYLHALKLREGNPGILIFENKLMHNRIDEADLSKYTKKDNEQQSLF